MPDKSSDWITGKKVGKSHRAAVVERIILLFMVFSGEDSCLSLRGLCSPKKKKNICCDPGTLASCSLTIFLCDQLCHSVLSFQQDTYAVKVESRRTLEKFLQKLQWVEGRTANFIRLVLLPGQTDQTHQAAAGGEWGAPVHQSAADTEGDDDKRTRLRGEGIYTCCFHHLPVAVPKTHPHVR